MKNIYSCIFIFLNVIGYSQTLIPNGDFETYAGCPTGFSQIDSLMNWVNPSTGIPQNSTGTPDYYNVCANSSTHVSVPNNVNSYQNAHSGGGYCGIYLYCRDNYLNNVREYIETPLTNPLVAGNVYFFEMYVNLANEGNYSTSTIGVYFSDTLISNVQNYNPLPFLPQIINDTNNFLDTLSWRQISGYYTAHGGENYIIIGNFQNDTTTKLNHINNATHAAFSYCNIDDVSLSNVTGITNFENDIQSFNLFPIPMTNELKIRTDKPGQAEITIHDCLSKIKIKQTFESTTTINTASLDKGIYIYSIRIGHDLVQTGKLIK